VAYIFKTLGRFPSEVYNLPPLEKELVYQVTLAKIKAEEKAPKGGW